MADQQQVVDYQEAYYQIVEKRAHELASTILVDFFRLCAKSNFTNLEEALTKQKEQTSDEAVTNILGKVLIQAMKDSF